MVAAVDCCEVIYLLQCRRCRRQFCICRHCYRGHAYCSTECSAAARYEQVRDARRRNRAGEYGKLNHSDQESARRERRRKVQTVCVGDHTSPVVIVSCTLPVPGAPYSNFAGSEPPGRESDHVPAVFKPVQQRVRCIVCGREGSFVHLSMLPGRILRRERVLRL